MITVKLHCGMCENEKSVQFVAHDDDISKMSANDLIRKAATLKGEDYFRNPTAVKWVVQDNGVGVLDTYCSKKCAE